MKKHITYLLIILIIVLTLTNYHVFTNSIRLSFDICIKNLIPSIIPFLLLSNILIKYNILEFNNIALLILCVISGSPSNSKYIKEYLNNNIINEIDASKLLCFLQYFNPIYIISTIGIEVLNSKKLGIIILFSNILSSLLLYKRVKFNNHEKEIIIKFDIFNKAIIDIINTILYIIGIITVFFIMTSYIDIIFNINIKYKYIYGLIEITQGINYLKYSNLSIYLKTVIASIFISFGGLSMHAQIFGILDNKKIRYKPYLISRIKHSILSTVIVTIAFYILN